MPAGVAVWQPYGAVGTKGLGDMWHAGQDGCRGRWEVEGGVWLRSNNTVMLGVFGANETRCCSG
jgi:hypothetical protein